MSEGPPGPERSGGPTPLRLPDPGPLFEARAARLAVLAEGHAAPEWLRLLSRVAAGQARAARELRPEPVAAGGGQPPLPYDRLPRDGAWRRMLALVVDAARGPGLPLETREALRRLADSGATHLEALADAVLAGAVPAERLACAPFVGAALQAWLATLAARLDGRALAPGPGGACPACGGPPLASLVGAGDRLRWVACALCATAWNVPRVRCVACETGAAPEYLHVEGDPGAKAEACSTCRTYVKVFDEERRPGAEPAADDAATIALDLLLDEEGFHRAGPNLYVGAARVTS